MHLPEPTWPSCRPSRPRHGRREICLLGFLARNNAATFRVDGTIPQKCVSLDIIQKTPTRMGIVPSTLKPRRMRRHALVWRPLTDSFFVPRCQSFAALALRTEHILWHAVGSSNALPIKAYSGKIAAYTHRTWGPLRSQLNLVQPNKPERPWDYTSTVRFQAAQCLTTFPPRNSNTNNCGKASGFRYKQHSSPQLPIESPWRQMGHAMEATGTGANSCPKRIQEAAFLLVASS